MQANFENILHRRKDKGYTYLEDIAPFLEMIDVLLYIEDNLENLKTAYIELLNNYSDKLLEMSAIEVAQKEVAEQEQKLEDERKEKVLKNWQEVFLVI